MDQFSSDAFTELDLAIFEYRLQNLDGSPVIYPNVRKIYIDEKWGRVNYNKLDNLMFPNLEEIIIINAIDPQNTILKSIGPLLIAYDKLRFVFSAGKNETLTLPKEIKAIGYQAFKHTYCSHIICEFPYIDCHVSAFEDSYWQQTNEFLIINKTLFRAQYKRNTLTIPDDITEIDDRAFDCFPAHAAINVINTPYPLSSMSKNLDYTIIKNHLFKIGKYIIRNAPYIDIDILAHMDCLKNIEICNQDNTSPYKTVDGILYSKDLTSLIYYPCGKSQKTFKLPDGTKHINCAAFCHPTGKKLKLILPQSLKTISEHAFMNTQITDLTVHLNTAAGIFNALPVIPQSLHVVQPDGSVIDYQFKKSNPSLKEQFSLIWDQHQFDPDHIDFALFAASSDRAKKRQIALQNIAHNNALPCYIDYLKRSAFAYGKDIMSQRNETLVINYLRDESVYLSVNALKKLLKLSQELQLATVTAYLMNYLHEREPQNGSLKL
ncbi:MAG: leucine-rich repeat protein [Proteobacteria bacterium]|nr:leucine-rich repeat protein [Pseudomonadota bacterium]